MRPTLLLFIVSTANPAVIFSKTYCPYCDLAKNNLTAEGGKFEVIELDQRDDGSAIQAALAQLTGRRTVPNGKRHVVVLSFINQGAVLSDR
jgi:glutaredoxin